MLVHRGKVLFYYDGPVLFSYDSNDRDYICMPLEEGYVVVRVKSWRLHLFKFGIIDLRDLVYGRPWYLGKPDSELFLKLTEQHGPMVLPKPGFFI